MTVLVWMVLVTAAAVSGLFLVNLGHFRKAPPAVDTPEKMKVSVLIPARNEAARIDLLLDSVLASEGIIYEVCVLDDESDDGTDAIVLGYGTNHPHVRLIRGLQFPAVGAANSSLAGNSLNKQRFQNSYFSMPMWH